jgi:hypothetical protein
MYIETGIKICFPVEEDQGNFLKDVVITNEIAAAEIIESFKLSRGQLSENYLRAWKEENLYVLKLVGEYGATIDYCGYIITEPKQHVNIFTRYKKDLHPQNIIRMIHNEQEEENKFEMFRDQSVQILVS